jgi:hypothetical protein
VTDVVIRAIERTATNEGFETLKRLVFWQWTNGYALSGVSKKRQPLQSGRKKERPQSGRHGWDIAIFWDYAFSRQGRPNTELFGATKVANWLQSGGNLCKTKMEVQRRKQML